MSVDQYNTPIQPENVYSLSEEVARAAVLAAQSESEILPSYEASERPPLAEDYKEVQTLRDYNAQPERQVADASSEAVVIPFSSAGGAKLTHMVAEVRSLKDAA